MLRRASNTLDQAPCRVLITGANGGIGAALAGAYAQPGCELVLQGRDGDALRALQQRCAALGASADILVHDLRDVDGWMQQLQRLDAQQPLDLVLVSAGLASTTPDGLEPWPAMEAMLEVNLRAALATVATLAPRMRARGSGHLVLVGSLSAWVGMPISPTYCATKAGLKAYAESMRGALRGTGVAVTLVQPGFVRSAMSDRFQAPKPWLMNADEAAQRIRSALACRPARLDFPGLLNMGLRGLTLLPPDWAQAVLRRLGYGGRV